MEQSLVNIMHDFPVELSTFFLAMTPIGELRLSIPIAITVYKMHPIAALLWSMAGNIGITIIVLFILEHGVEWLLRHSRKVEILWQRYIDNLRLKHAKNFDRWGAVALVLFVAVPIPLTGAISGAIVASVFQIPIARALPLLTLGILIAGAIVTLLTLGIRGFFFL